MVFLTEKCHRLLWPVKGWQRGRSNARASTQSGLSDLKQENAHRRERRVIRSESNSNS